MFTSYVSDEVVSIPNYSILRRDADEPGHTGIAVYVHNSIRDFTHRRYDLESTYVESICLQVKTGRGPTFLIAFIYRRTPKGLKVKFNSLIWYPTKRVFLDAFFMTEENMKSFYNRCILIKPVILQGFVGGIFDFARYCEKNNLKLPSIKAVWVTSGPLSQSSRIFLEFIFNAPVYNQYGCSEVFWLASECSKKEGFHVLSDVRYLEILDNNNSALPIGEYGDVAITDLENYVFPFIRYKNGDVACYSEDKCSCGLSFPLLKKDIYRTQDRLVFSSKVVNAEHLITIFDDTPTAVEEFQIYQHKDYSLTLFCVLGSREDALHICYKKVELLKEIIENEVSVKLKIVKNIDHNSGKIRLIVSEI